LQSSEWEEFQQAVGRKTWRIQGILLIRQDLPLGFDYLYSPRADMSGPDGAMALGEAKKIAEKERLIFLKVEPEIADLGALKTLGFFKSAKEIQPSETVIIDLTQSEQEILDRMHEKTRYNIRLAQKHGIEIKELGDGFDPVWEIFRETAKRDRFSLHPRSYYEKMVEVLKPAGLLKIFGAFYKNELVAANIMIFYPPPLENKTPFSAREAQFSKGGGRVTYLHGASNNDFRNLMAPYGLHWHIIKEAKGNGFEEYDFWGISERYAGVSRFKKGFGGKETIYPGSFDYLSNLLWYNLYKLGSGLKDILGFKNLN